MLSSPVIDLAVGLTFVFGVTAALASFITELISRFLGLRGAYLLSGLRELVDGGGVETDLTNVTGDYTAMQKLMRSAEPSAAQAPAAGPPAAGPPAAGPPAAQAPAPEPSATQQPGPAPAAGAKRMSATGALLGGPILGNQGVAGQLETRKLTLGKTTGTGRLPKMTPDPQAGRRQWFLPRLRSLWRMRRSLPSYISGKSFSEAVIDLVVPNAQGETTMAALKDNVAKVPGPFGQSLQALVTNADGDFSQFSTSVEQWYDDHMDRVSGWYKRHVAVITVVAGTVIVVLLNLNALTIGRTLYTENAVSAAVSTVAAKATSCSNENQQECLANLEGQLSAAAAAGLPVGWGTVRDCTESTARCNWMDRRGLFSRYGNSGAQLVLVIVGFLIMIISVVPGAQFWFGLLTKLGTLRATGPKPAAAPQS